MLRSRGGRPSLIGTAARTAVVAGTATAVAGSVSRSGQQKAAAKQAQAEAVAQQQAAEQQAQVDAAVQQALANQAATASGSQSDATVEQLQKLAELHQAGVLSDEEFAAMKAKVLAS